MTTISKYVVMLLLSIVILFTSCSSIDDINSSATNYTSVENVLTNIDFQGYAIVTKNTFF